MNFLERLLSRKKTHEIKKNTKSTERSSNVFDKLFNSLNLAEVIIECLKQYIQEVKVKKVIYPAYTRTDQDNRAGIGQIWEDTLLEVFWWFFDDGNGGEFIGQLAAPGENQLPAYQTFIQLAEISFSQEIAIMPCKIEHAVIAGFKCIQKLNKLWINNFIILEGDNKEQYTKKYHKIEKHIVSDMMERELVENHAQLIKLHNGDNPNSCFPKTLFDIIYEEVMRCSKEIALYAKFGWMPEKMYYDLIKHTASQMRQDHVSESKIQAFQTSSEKNWRLIKMAKAPEDIINKLNYD